jgi:hypothetical protein
LSAQQSVQSLERELLASQQQLVEARINLLRALSGGWQPLVYPAPLVIEEDNQSYPLPIPFKDGASE